MPDPVTPRRHTAPSLLLLTAIVPGLGHAVAGRRRAALVLVAPFVLIAAACAWLFLADGAVSLAARLLDPAVLGGLLVLQAAVVAWRLAALGAVLRIARSRSRTPTAAAGVLALALVLIPQAYAAGLTLVARDAALDIFGPVAENPGPAVTPGIPPSLPPFAPDDPDFASVPGSGRPTPAAPGMETRVNVLLIGMDSGVGRNTALTDTMIVASLDPIGGTVSMVSIPRDMVDVPISDTVSFRGKINSLVSYVRWHPSRFPGYADGQTVLAAALGNLLGLRIDYWAQVDLGGFIRVIDTVGGVNVQVRTAFCDPGYDEYGINGFGITPGRYHMNGYQALAYARIRKASGESDFTRAARQQDVVAALRDRIVGGGLLNDPAGFLQSMGRAVRTNVPPSIIADQLGAATKVPRSETYRAVISHPLVRSGFDERGSIQIPDLEAIRALAIRLFPLPGTKPTGVETVPEDTGGSTRSPSNSTDCGIKPTPRPSVAPSASPSASPDESPSDEPTATPTAAATGTPTATPASTATPTPTATATPAATPTPTAAPTASASPAPTKGPPGP